MPLAFTDDARFSSADFDCRSGVSFANDAQLSGYDIQNFIPIWMNFPFVGWHPITSDGYNSDVQAINPCRRTWFKDTGRDGKIAVNVEQIPRYIDGDNLMHYGLWCIHSCGVSRNWWKGVYFVSMNEISPLMLQLLEWISSRPRSYTETMEAWRTSCPRLTIWEDALTNGLIQVETDGDGAAGDLRVSLTALGRSELGEFNDD